MNRTTRSLSAAAMATCLFVLAGGAAVAQEAVNLLPMIPTDAFLVVERQGHDAIQKVFDETNTGRLYNDEAVHQFLVDTRDGVGEMIAKDMLGFTDEEEIKACRQSLHKFLLPFWHSPSVMFAVPNAKAGRDPGIGFIVVPRRDLREDCVRAAEALRLIGVPAGGEAGRRQSFSYTSGAVEWKGVAKSYEDFQLPEDAAARREKLEQCSLFLVVYRAPVLYVATSLSAADAMSKAMSTPDTPQIRASMKAVRAKTELKDWAIRWHVDIDRSVKAATEEGEKDPRDNETVKALQLEKVRSVGGTIGYADGVLTRYTYIDAPGCDNGPVRMLKNGGDYRKALAMVPAEASFLLAGQWDKKAAVTTLLVAMGTTPDALRRIDVSPEGKVTLTPETDTQKAGEDRDARLKGGVGIINSFTDALTDDFAFFAADLQAMVGGSPPVGIIVGIRDEEKARKALTELTKLPPFQGSAPAEEGAESQPANAYRKVEIVSIAEGNMHVAILKDRIIFGLADSATKAAIDAALDGTGGFEPDGKAEKMGKLLPKGSAIFSMNTPALVKLVWPMLMEQKKEMDESGYGGGPLKALRSLPSTAKLARLLDPEMAAFTPDKDGLLLSSRGTVPLLTKAVPMMGLGGGFWFFMMLR